MKANFKTYEEQDYQQVCDFFVDLNIKEDLHFNWNWARWEWMYFHPYFDREKMGTIGLWKTGERIVGVALYDLFYGEAFCAALPDNMELMPDILEYALKTFKDENGLGIAVNDADVHTKELLQNLGFQKVEQTETLLSISLESKISYELPKKMKIREIHFPVDNMAYQTVIWKGFDHEGDVVELEKMLHNSDNMPIHRKPSLCLAVVDEQGEFAAHCTCWHDKRTNYAYVEPVCTIPAYRGRGLGIAVVIETLNRCRESGARIAYVLSDMDFYKKIGFTPHSHYTFYHIEK